MILRTFWPLFVWLTAVDCGHPGQPANSILRGTIFTYQKVVDYICQTGYYVSGRTSLRCGADGKWNGQMPSCVPVPCPTLTVPKNAILPQYRSSFGGIAAYSCIQGWEIITGAKLLCTATGQWNASEPTCTRQRCPELKTPVNGTFIHYSRFHGGNVTLKCNTGFEPANPDTAVVTCNDGPEWSSAITTCTGKGQDRWCSPD